MVTDVVSSVSPVELNAEGTDYITHGDFLADDFQENWDVLLGIFEEAHDKLTRKETLRAWPYDYAKPTPPTLWRWLDRAVAEGRLLQDGLGRSRKPFRYWLPGKEAIWRLDPLHFEQPPSLEDEFFDDLARGTYDHALKPREKKRKKKGAGMDGVEDGLNT